MTARRRVLVVDDQADILDLTRAILAGEGFEVSTTPSGHEALRLARETRFDLVLLDINMPEVDGWQVLKMLRADEEVGDPPVVMFSVRGEVRSRVQGLQQGALDYIVKPFAVDELVRRVRRAIEETWSGPPGKPSLPPAP